MPTVPKIIAGAKSVLGGIPPKVLRPQVRRPGRATIPSAQSAPVESASAVPIAKTEAPAKPEAKVAEPAVKLLEGEPLDMPHGDLTVSEGVLVNWLKKIGDEVKQGEPVVEVETDKAIVAVEAPVAGKLIQIVAAVGKTVKMGETLGVIGK